MVLWKNKSPQRKPLKQKKRSKLLAEPRNMWPPTHRQPTDTPAEAAERVHLMAQAGKSHCSAGGPADHRFCFVFVLLLTFWEEFCCLMFFVRLLWLFFLIGWLVGYLLFFCFLFCSLRLLHTGILFSWLRCFCFWSLPGQSMPIDTCWRAANVQNNIMNIIWTDTSICSKTTEETWRIVYSWCCLNSWVMLS